MPTEPTYKITSATASDMSSHVSDVTIDSINTEGATGNGETRYQNTNWSKQLGIYKKIPEFKVALDMRSSWLISKKIKCDARTQVITEHITGSGKESFRKILKNMIICKRLGQDSYAEIIRDEKTGLLLNLKVLDSGSIAQVYDEAGILIRYEQVSKTKDGKNITFKPEEIFHLTNKRVGDEIRGTADSEVLQAIIEAQNESFVDMRKIMHRFVKPMFKFILDTDDQATINALVAKFDAAVNKGENIYIPKGTVEQELISVPSNSTLNSSEWRNYLRDYFYQCVGMPQIVIGGSAGTFTESTAKIAYLAFENSIKDEQTDLEDDVWNQLQLRINLEFPASLQNEMISDESKDADENTSFQPNDVMAGVGE